MTTTLAVNAMRQVCLKIEEVIPNWKWEDSFDWSIDYTGDVPLLTFKVRQPDNLTGEDGVTQAFRRVRLDVDPVIQLRDMVHAYLAHEADEQIQYRGERVFFPDHGDGNCGIYIRRDVQADDIFIRHVRV